MNKEFEIWQFAARVLRRNEPAALLLVAESAGSSPGRQGFKMIVAESEMRGSIGGGVMEQRFVEQARNQLKTNSEKLKIKNEELKIQDENPNDERPATKTEDRKPKTKGQNPNSAIVEQIHRANSAHASGMICSGAQTVVFRRLFPEDLPVVEKIAANLREHRAGRVRIDDYGISFAAEFLSPFDYRFRRDGDEFVYEEKLGYKNRLYIFGGGHCALALSEVMAKMDFHITVFDDRTDLNTLAENCFAHEKKIVSSYEMIGDSVAGGANAYAVVMTLGYRSDEIVIRKLIDINLKYFGVLGSRAKMKTLLKKLEKEGFAPEKLAALHAPAGLPINSRTPAEIAVSIAAEIIAVKNF